MSLLIQAIFALAFVALMALVIAMDRWWNLIGAILTGSKKYLEADILDSGICEKKRATWSPVRKKQKPWFTYFSINYPGEEPEQNIVDRFQNNCKKRKKRKRNELDDLVDEMFSELK